MGQIAARRGIVQCLPNYLDGSIVNLMSSILKSYGNESHYQPLKLLPPDELKDAQNIVLIVVDGLGYEYCMRHGKASVFSEHMRGSITSVFPATTASGVTTFLTGLAPQQHAITGWFMHIKELGMVAKILPFTPRGGGFGSIKINPKIIVDQKSIFDMIDVNTFYIIQAELLESEYTMATSGKAKRIQYYALTEFFTNVRDVITSDKSRKYIYAYWPDFDALCHAQGVESAETLSHFKELNSSVRVFLESIKNTGTTVIITADHGLIDTDVSRTIRLMEHPHLIDTLVLPLCGEPRVAYCYVHPARAQHFEEYVQRHLKHCCELHRSEELIKSNYFGLFEPNPCLYDRVGDYALIMKENYVVKDLVLGEKEHHHKGNHGGVSREEMLVPLVVMKTNT